MNQYVVLQLTKEAGSLRLLWWHRKHGMWGGAGIALKGVLLLLITQYASSIQIKDLAYLLVHLKYVHPNLLLPFSAIYYFSLLSFLVTSHFLHCQIRFLTTFNCPNT